MTLAGIVLPFLSIGLLLGLLGGGGSVLTVPVLVYLFGYDPKGAIATSLVVVGITSLIAMMQHARAGRVCWKTGLVFAAGGMGGAYAGGRLAQFIPGSVLLILFAGVMLAAATAMLRRSGDATDSGLKAGSLCPARLPIAAVLLDGLLVGGVTGLVGAGGGFVVVPALNLLGRLPMHAAVGTSLLVVTLNAVAALAGHASHVSIDIGVTAQITAVTVVGSLAGGALAGRIGSHSLRRVFGLFVIGVAVYLLYRELDPAMLADIRLQLIRHREFAFGMLSLVLLVGLLRLRDRLRRNFDAQDGSATAQRRRKSDLENRRRGTIFRVPSTRRRGGDHDHPLRPL